MDKYAQAQMPIIPSTAAYGKNYQNPLDYSHSW